MTAETSAQIDAHIESAATLAKDINSTTTSWIWKVAGGVAIACVLGWIKWELSQKEEELAKAKTELEMLRLKAQQDSVNAKVADLEEERAEFAKSAAEAHAKLLLDEQKLLVAKKFQSERAAKVKAIADKDWDGLNNLVGIK